MRTIFTLLAALILLTCGTALAANDRTSDFYSTYQEVAEVYKRFGPESPLSAQDVELLEGQALYLEKSHQAGQRHHTHNQRPIAYFVFENLKQETVPAHTILWVGGLHPDEFAPSFLSWKFLGEFANEFSRQQDVLPEGLRLVYVPMTNLDGFIDSFIRHGYPTRENIRGQDLNRSFYSRQHLPNYKGEPEIEFLLDLISKYSPDYWVIPHSALFILDLDGAHLPAHLDWVKKINLASGQNGGAPIPIKNHQVFGPPGSFKNWSIGRLANEISKEQRPISALTFELGGPGETPDPRSPDYQLQVARRKQLGRFENNTHIALEYYQDYVSALWQTLQIN